MQGMRQAGSEYSAPAWLLKQTIMPRPKRDYVRINLKLTTGTDKNATGNLLQYFADCTGMGKTWLLESAFVLMAHDRRFWVYCPQCDSPVTSTLIQVEVAEARCRSCGHEFKVKD